MDQATERFSPWRFRWRLLTYCRPLECQSIKRRTCGSGLVWRGGLSERRIAPFGCVAVVKPLHAVNLIHRDCRFWGRFATQRGQAPSPHKPAPTGIVVLLTIISRPTHTTNQSEPSTVDAAHPS